MNKELFGNILVLKSYVDFAKTNENKQQLIIDITNDNIPREWN